MDSRGRLFVGDRENNRIQIFDQDGKLLDEWRQFGRPSGIYIDEDDTIYVADSRVRPRHGAHEIPAIKKGIRIGSARNGGRVTSSKTWNSRLPTIAGRKGSASTHRETLRGRCPTSRARSVDPREVVSRQVPPQSRVWPLRQSKVAGLQPNAGCSRKTSINSSDALAVLLLNLTSRFLFPSGRRRGRRRQSSSSCLEEQSLPRRSFLSCPQAQNADEAELEVLMIQQDSRKASRKAIDRLGLAVRSKVASAGGSL